MEQKIYFTKSYHKTRKRKSNRQIEVVPLTITICNVYYKTEKVARNSYY